MNKLILAALIAYLEISLVMDIGVVKPAFVVDWILVLKSIVVIGPVALFAYLAGLEDGKGES